MRPSQAPSTTTLDWLGNSLRREGWVGGGGGDYAVKLDFELCGIMQKLCGIMQNLCGVAKRDLSRAHRKPMRKAHHESAECLRYDDGPAGKVVVRGRTLSAPARGSKWDPLPHRALALGPPCTGWAGVCEAHNPVGSACTATPGCGSGTPLARGVRSW